MIFRITNAVTIRIGTGGRSWRGDHWCGFVVSKSISDTGREEVKVIDLVVVEAFGFKAHGPVTDVVSNAHTIGQLYVIV